MTKVVLACLACLVLAEPQTPAGLAFDTPPGWSARQNGPPGGPVTLLPPGAPAGSCAVLIFAAQEATGPAQSVLEQLVRNISVSNRTIAGPDYQDVGSFRVAVLVQQTPLSLTQYIAIHVARWETKSQAVVFMATDLALFQTHTPAVQAMLRKVTVPAPAPPFPAPSPAPFPAHPPGGPIPGTGAGRPRVVEAYRRAAMRGHIGLTGTSVERVHFERIVLLSNGVTDFVRYHATGLAADPELAAATPSTLNGYYGTWRTEGNTVVVRRQRGLPEEVLRRENGNLVYGDQVWTPAPRVDGLRLSGRYAYRSEPNGPMQYNYWADFTADGRFTTGGLLFFFAVSDALGRPKPPMDATGTYEIRDWTIWFRVNGAIVWSAEFMPVDDDVRNLATVLVDFMALRRQ